MRLSRTTTALFGAVALMVATVTPAFAGPDAGVPQGNAIWNGYVSHITKTSRAYFVAANWTVPHIKCAGLTKTTSAGMWVGLGGVNSPVIQVGVQMLCFHDVLVIAPIWEITPPQRSVQPILHKVHAGDLIEASVSYGAFAGGSNKPGTYALLIQDNSRNWTWTKDAHGPKEVPREADWIVEAGGKPLANFGTARFTSCVYTVDKAGKRKSLKDAVKFEAGTSKGLETSVSRPARHDTAFSLKFQRP